MLAMLKTTLGPQPGDNGKYRASGQTGRRQSAVRSETVTRDEVTRLFRRDLDNLSDRAARTSQDRPQS